ncbi:hypothetical protein [Mucilaginibacter psychrotolerans]|uniref:Lipoprotein n=1 Tax=Mucilaginibacter psychrotolerans TaxID=1524096 RepID=A0A4Y8S9X6_9SPHI|nr:hypothetical protein [Mucilaginibacter psychrotolerans]TFF35224.1 hypothetical protein E2R66_19875 [Mucilaginibacter psychrotolerans]
MKPFLLFFVAITVAGCASKNDSGCLFSEARVKASEITTDKPINDVTIKDCFKATGPDDMGLVEIAGEQTSDKFKVSYYEPGDSNAMDMLNVKIGGKLSEWRSKKGHDIYVRGTTKSDSLALLFGDRTGSKIKGSVVFKK